jgi:transmembrane protein 231
LQNEYFLWHTGRVQGEPFTLKANLHIPEQTIVFKPGFWQVMKWAWLQYLALLVLVKTGTETLKHWIFSKHVVPVIKMTPPWIKSF